MNKNRKSTDNTSASEVSKVPSSDWRTAMAIFTRTGAVPKGTAQDIQDLNKTLRFGKSQNDVPIRFLAKPNEETKNGFELRNMTLVPTLVLARDEMDHLRAATISWRSFKLPRVCRSSLGAECQAVLEELLLARRSWRS